MKTFLTEAFQQMELIESNEFTFDTKGATELANFLEGDMLNDFEDIIDPEATTEDDLKDSYIGNVVCECQICRSKIFKEPEDIKLDSEDAELANVGECCPYCFETDGFKIIGQVAPYETVTVETDGDATDVKVEVDGDSVEPEQDELEPTARHAKDNEDLEDSQRYPVEGTKQVNLTEKKSKRHARDNEDLEDSQRYPIKSPVGTKGLKEEYEDEAEDKTENKEDKKAKLARKMRLARHKKDNEDLEDSQRYPIKSPAPAQTGLAMMEGMSIRDKLEKAFPGVFNFSEKKEESLKEGKEDQELSNLGYKIVPVIKGNEAVLALMDVSTHKRVSVPADLDLHDSHAVIDYVKTNLKSQMQESLTEGMEDISITTDDQVIKVKATPRADKEAIQPVTDETKEVIETEEAPIEEPIIETEEDVEITDFDEEAFDELGESYLKRVYDNVESFRTTDGSISGNKLMLEGVIKFNSGKSAKTKFVFEAQTITKTGKVKLKGLNEHITTNKNSFTLTGTVKDRKLLVESLNYNYGARSDEGKMKRLYGTVKRNVK